MLAWFGEPPPPAAPAFATAKFVIFELPPAFPEPPDGPDPGPPFPPAPTENENPVALATGPV